MLPATAAEPTVTVWLAAIITVWQAVGTTPPTHVAALDHEPVREDVIAPAVVTIEAAAVPTYIGAAVNDANGIPVLNANGDDVPSWWVPPNADVAFIICEDPSFAIYPEVAYNPILKFGAKVNWTADVIDAVTGCDNVKVVPEIAVTTVPLGTFVPITAKPTVISEFATSNVTVLEPDVIPVALVNEAAPKVNLAAVVIEAIAPLDKVKVVPEIAVTKVLAGTLVEITIWPTLMLAFAAAKVTVALAAVIPVAEVSWKNKPPFVKLNALPVPEVLLFGVETVQLPLYLLFMV